MTLRIDVLPLPAARLGESPLWDPVAQRLWWVDTLGCRIHATATKDAAAVDWHFPRTVGSIGLAEGGLVAALDDGFYSIDGENGAASLIARPEAGAVPLRFNDGKADRQGRFLSVQTHLPSANPAAAPAGGLWRVDRYGGLRCLAGDFALGNAICFSPNGDTLYVADTLEGVVRSYRYDAGEGALAPPYDLIDCRPHGSLPDGATVDATGNLWIALVLAQAVACFAPNGRLLRRIDLPLPFPSCPAFGGVDLATLFVTTIADSGHRLKSDHPDAGRIMAINGLGATGLPEARYRRHHMSE